MKLNSFIPMDKGFFGDVVTVVREMNTLPKMKLEQSSLDDFCKYLQTQMKVNLEKSPVYDVVKKAV